VACCRGVCVGIDVDIGLVVGLVACDVGIGFVVEVLVLALTLWEAKQRVPQGHSLRQENPNPLTCSQSPCRVKRGR
jgi:hypothetical protein